MYLWHLKHERKKNFHILHRKEMYQDNKFKKIMGPLDYQAAMLNLYIENADKKTVALELPTGSGKTLVGLLIGEYRRRKNKEKSIVFVSNKSISASGCRAGKFKIWVKSNCFLWETERLSAEG